MYPSYGQHPDRAGWRSRFNVHRPVNSDTSRHDHSTPSHCHCIWRRRPHHRLVTRHHRKIGLAKRRTAQRNSKRRPLLGTESTAAKPQPSALSLARPNPRLRETTSQPRFLSIHCSAQDSLPNGAHPRYHSRGTRRATERRRRGLDPRTHTARLRTRHQTATIRYIPRAAQYLRRRDGIPTSFPQNCWRATQRDLRAGYQRHFGTEALRRPCHVTCPRLCLPPDAHRDARHV